MAIVVYEDLMRMFRALLKVAPSEVAAEAILRDAVDRVVLDYYGDSQHPDREADPIIYREI